MSITDLHVHTSPSLLPRHVRDDDADQILRNLGVTEFVLKAHEGSTAERAALVGGGAVGGVVLNASVGGANASAVEVAAALGARVIWLPTISSAAHRRSQRAAELGVHTVEMPVVDVTRDQVLLDEWHDVLDVVAQHDLVLASGHVAIDEAITVFRAARSHGVRRLLVNHPLLPFLGWRPGHAEVLANLDAHVEVGVVADLLAPEESATARLIHAFPISLLVFGSDLGHCNFPTFEEGIPDWLDRASAVFGTPRVEQIVGANGHDLIHP